MVISTNHRIKGFRQLGIAPSGFTLIELIVVISLISLMLFFALPRLSSDVLGDDLNTASRWIVLKVRTLKDKARLEQQIYVLHLDMNADRLWASNATMSEEELEKAAGAAYQLPEGIKLLDVEYSSGKVATGTAEIWVFQNGYSEKALIHLANRANEIRSFLIEPYLPSVKLFNEEVGLES
ncbi:Tfp pilus assembly protein FimT/FimU [Thermodesulfobacteriota bacterium]